ncbi:MAG: hydrogenase formation protein HypD, partial [Ruminococcus sp.]|nr:hydrogenase formation protein HypD [Ruminococcus sp.]
MDSVKNELSPKQILQSYDGRKLRIMEVCGTHTHEIFRLGIRKILPENIDLISGPGCPVCVTPVGFIDEACWLALEKNCVICTFGDLIRVPGTQLSLAGARAQGAQIKTVYSPLDAVEFAKENPDKQVVFLAVGFETTTPSACLAVEKAKAAGLENFSILCANKTMPNAYQALKGSADAFLFPGHVNAITGNATCKALCEQGVSGVVAGFTAKELMTALAVTVAKLQKSEPFFVNCYPRVVKDEGSPAAQKLMVKVMQPCDSEWRGLGVIKMSCMTLRDEYA